MSRPSPAPQRRSVAERYSRQLAADLEYIRSYGRGEVTLAAHTQPVGEGHPDGEPVINYDDYMARQPTSAAPPVIVADEMAPYPIHAAPTLGGGFGECSGSCGPVECFDDCCPPTGCWQPRAWVDVSYLLWWVKGFSTPPLATRSPAGTARDVAGVLGEPTTTVLFGGDRLAGDVLSGGRVTLGWWLDPCNTSGIQATYFGLETASDDFYAASDGGPADPALGRPFFNVEAGFEGQDAELIAFPNELSGYIQAHATSSFEGLDILWRRHMGEGYCFNYDLLLGWRYARLEDELVVHDFRTSLDDASGLTVGTTIEETDVFRTQNWFSGPEIGVVARRRWCRWTTELMMKLALGNTRSEVVIDGRTITTVPLPGGGTDVAVTDAGLLAQQTNIGSYGYDQFSVIPELGVTFGYNLTPCLQAKIGYSFIYWSRVARAGDQIDTDLNLTQLDPGGLVGNPRPRFDWVFDDMWAQGLSFGLDYTF